MNAQMKSEEKATECAACGGPIVQGVGADDEFCSEECYRTGRAFCRTCGRPLSQSIKGYKREYCSALCSSRYRSATPISSSYIKERFRSTCKTCGKSITQSKYGGRKYCDTKCSNRYRVAEKHGLDLTQEWGVYGPEMQKCLREIQSQMGMGAAKRLATAINREYVMRRGVCKNTPLVLCHCKTCGKEFYRRRSSTQNKDYCSGKCKPKIVINVGEKAAAAKLTWEQVDEIRNRYATEHLSLSVLGRMYGVSQSTIHYIVTYRHWKPENDPRRKDATS